VRLSGTEHRIEALFHQQIDSAVDILGGGQWSCALQENHLFGNCLLSLDVMIGVKQRRLRTRLVTSELGRAGDDPGAVAARDPRDLLVLCRDIYLVKSLRRPRGFDEVSNERLATHFSQILARYLFGAAARWNDRHG
jgi:hypothetical protein